MNSLKIPDLNLFRGKRTTRLTQYDTLQQEGIKQLENNNKKDFLKDIKTQLYLETYKTNLNHFISPTKNKQKAEQILRNRGKKDQLLLRAISFPKSRYHCPNCFYHQIENHKKIRCQCEIEQKPLPIRKEQQIDHRTSNASRQVKNQITQIRQITFTNRLTTVTDEAIGSSNPTSKKQISFNISEESQSIKNINIKFQENKQNLSQQQQTQLTWAEQQKLKENQHKFRNQISNQQQYLQQIDIDVSDSRSISIDFNDLIQAKQQYMAKSKEIINRLDTIIEQRGSNIHY